jgi:Fe-S cluster assembly iron-binding protein IscA
MLTVTAMAKEKLKGRLQRSNPEPDVMIRLIPSPADPARMKMVWGKEKAKDHVVESEDGMKVLLVGADLVSTLEGMIIDFRKTPKGTGFTLSKRAAKT